MGNISSGVPCSLCFLVRVRGGDAPGVGGGIAPGGAVGGSCLESWGVEGWCLCFPSVGTRLDSSAVPSVSGMSEAAHDSPSSSQSDGIVGVFGSTPVVRRQLTTARIIPPGVESRKSVAMALRLSVGEKM